MTIYIDGVKTNNVLAYSSGGGEKFTPTFTETVIGTNDNQRSFTLSEDYHNFDFVKVTTHNVNSGIDTDFVTTPSIIDGCLTFGAVNFNEFNTNQYVAYSTSDLTWSQYGSSRNLYVSEVRGVNCTNASVSETLIFQAQSATLSSTSITYSQGSLFDFDLILFGANSNSVDEIQPCYFPFYSSVRLMNETPFNAYYSCNIVSVSEHELSSSRYACVVGINFNPN